MNVATPAVPGSCTPDFTADALYVVGGLYGNLAALAEIEAMTACDPVRAAP